MDLGSVIAAVSRGSLPMTQSCSYIPVQPANAASLRPRRRCGAERTAYPLGRRTTPWQAAAVAVYPDRVAGVEAPTQSAEANPNW